MNDRILFIALGLFIFLTLYFFFNDWKKPAKKILMKAKEINDLSRIERSLEEKIFKTDDLNHMKYRVKMITGAKNTRAQQLKTRINEVVLNKYHTWSYLSYTFTTLICVFIGFTIGGILNNVSATVILVLVFMSFPYLFLVYRIKILDKDKDKKLLIVMGNIQATYMNRDSFVLSVKEILDTIPDPLHQHFKLFVDEMLYFGTHQMDEAAERLAYAVNNHFFYEFMQLAIQAEKGSPGLKYTMKSVPQDYQRFLDKNEKYARIVEDYNIQFLLRIILFPFGIGFVRMISEEYYLILTNHPMGKFVLTILILIYVVSSIIYMRYNKDIQFEL